ncbi:MAG: hypothetical protein GY719_32510 [bacterium]|nr:hypothetical protein [bacterium]
MGGFARGRRRAQRSGSAASPKPRQATLAARLQFHEALHLQRTAGNQATRAALAQQTVLAQQVRSGAPGTGAASSTARQSSNWPALAGSAQAALASGDTSRARRLYRRAIRQAVAGARFPDGIPRRVPSLSDIWVSFNPPGATAHSDVEDAATDAHLVKDNPENYWRWIYFTPKSLRQTRAYTEAVITHELIHVRQYTRWWQDYEANGQGTWEAYLNALKGGSARSKGPIELEGHTTALDYLKRMGAAEQDAVLRSVFKHYILTLGYVAPAGVDLEIEPATVRRQLVAAYRSAGSGLRRRMGTKLWEAAIATAKTTSAWEHLADRFRFLLVTGYNVANRTRRQIYQDALDAAGLSLDSLRRR